MSIPQKKNQAQKEREITRTIDNLLEKSYEGIFNPIHHQAPQLPITTVPFENKSDKACDEDTDLPALVVWYASEKSPDESNPGLKYDKAFEHVKDAKASVFAFNETHTNQMNAQNNTALRMSQRQMFLSKHKEHCKLVSSSSLASNIDYHQARR